MTSININLNNVWNYDMTVPTLHEEPQLNICAENENCKYDTTTIGSFTDFNYRFQYNVINYRFLTNQSLISNNSRSNN